MGFASVVFAGGGCRCFWQAGFWREAGHLLQPRAIAAVSAGAAFACAAIGGTTDAVLAAFKRRTAANPRNFYLRRAPGRARFPHHEMYRGTVIETADAAMLERLRAGPEIRVSLGRPPAGWRPATAAAIGLLAYQADAIVRRGVHPRLPRALGFHAEVIPAHACGTPEELADLILQSSCLPPLTPLLHRDGKPVIDGAVVEGVPARVVADLRPTLVLLTRRDLRVPQREGVRFVQPSQPVPIEMWDYTDPRGVQQSFDLGRRDGEAFARTWAG
jgi:predicted acylesterase/phospholipase RssA